MGLTELRQSQKSVPPMLALPLLPLWGGRNQCGFECGDGDLAIGCAAKNAAIQQTGSSGERWIAVKKPFENWRGDHDHLHPS